MAHPPGPRPPPPRRGFLHRLTAGGLAVAAGPWAVRAEAAYPSRALQLVVPGSPGGALDLLARRVADTIAQRHGWTLIVDNHPGAGGTLAADRVAAAAPDGHTVLVGSTGTQAINPLLYRHARFDPREALDGVVLQAITQNVLLAHRQLGVASMAAFEQLARSEPERIAVASPGVGTTQQLAADWLALLGGYRLRAVPYKATSQLRLDLLEGRVDAGITTLGAALREYLPGGTLRPLLVTGRERAQQLPQVPTGREHGYADFVVEAWSAWMVPHGTPAAVADLLNAAVRAAMEADAVQALLVDAGAVVPPWDVAHTRAFMRAEIAHWAPIVARLAPRPP